MTEKPAVTFRLLTIACILAAVLLAVVAFVYFSKTASDLPSFFPGHLAGSSKHHTKHGVAFVGLAVLAVIGVWFSTAPTKD